MKFLCVFLISACAEPDFFEMTNETDNFDTENTDATDNETDNETDDSSSGSSEVGDTNADSDADTDADTETEFLIPDFVCDYNEGCGDGICDIGEYWTCPLTADPVVIGVKTYRTQWLICDLDNGAWICPTNGYHRECSPAFGIGLSCHE